MGGPSQRNWSLHCDGVHIAPPLSSQPQEQSKGSSSFSRNKISNTASGLCLALHLAVNSVTGPPPSHCVPPQKCQQAIPVSHQETHVVQRLRAQTRTESKGGQPGMWKGLPSILSLTLGGRGALWSSSRVRQSQLGWCFPYGGTIWPLHLVTRSARQDRLRISHPCVHRGEKPQESYIQVSNTPSRSQRQAKCLLSLPALACPSHPDGPELLGGAGSRGTSPPLPRADLQEVCHKEDVSLCNFLTAPGRIIIPRGSARPALDPFTRGGWDHCPQQQQVASFPKTSAHLRAAQPRPQGLVLGARCRLALNNRALSLPAGSPAS